MMKQKIIYSTKYYFLVICILVGILSSCSDDDKNSYILQKTDISITSPEGGFVSKRGESFKIEVTSKSDDGVNYEWKLNDKIVSKDKNFEYTFDTNGVYKLVLKASQDNQISYDYPYSVTVKENLYTLQKEDIIITAPEDGFVAIIDQLFKIEVKSKSDEGVVYEWLLDDEAISSQKNFEYMFDTNGIYNLVLVVSQNEVKYELPFTVTAKFEGNDVPAPSEGSSPYITKVFDYVPAVGQFTNALPKYESGDNQEKMNAKVLAAIGNNKQGMISLGGYGGYVVVGFDHTIQNIKGKRDFRVLGNAFYAAANPNPNAPIGGSCEAGIIMVAYDKNKNGVPDEDEWYEIAGSAHEDPALETWYEMATKAGNNVNLYKNYEITYYKPDEKKTPVKDANQSFATDAEYVKWEDNKGFSGYKVKNIYHAQSYYPQWIEGDRLTFKGTCLPQNGIDESGKGNYFVLYKFRYGYADNELNKSDDSAIDIDWAVNAKGQKVNLPGVDFVKIYTGVNQENGWLGENSTEVIGVNDLHLLNEDIATR